MVTPSERSGCDLLLQSAGLLIICHMRGERRQRPAKIAPARDTGGGPTGRNHRIASIVKSGEVGVKPLVRAAPSPRPTSLRTAGIPSVLIGTSPMSMDAQRSFSFQ